MSKALLVPISEMSPESHSVFPYGAPLDRIGVYPGRLDTLACIGGFNPDVAINYCSPESGDEQAVGITASAGNVHTAFPFSSWHEASDLAIRVSVGNMEGSPVKDPAAWARPLDAAVSRELRRVVWENMVTGHSGRREFWHGLRTRRSF